MKRPTFFRGVLLAALMAVAVSIAFTALSPWLGFNAVARLVIPATMFGYLAYLLRASGEATGRLTVLALWSALAAIAWWISPPLPMYVLIHVCALWLVRSLYFYAGFVPALLDLALSTLAVGAFIWAVAHTGSVFLATWSFFLVQASFVAIPASIVRHLSSGNESIKGNEGFERARRQADQALRQLLNTS